MTSKSDIVREYLKDNPDVSRKDLPRIMYESYPDIFVSLKRAWAVVANVYNHAPQKIKPVIKTTGSITEAELRSMYDIRKIVKDELDDIPKGEFWRDADFVRRFQGKAGFRSVLESPEVSQYRGKASGQVFWGHPDSIKKLKQEGILL